MSVDEMRASRNRAEQQAVTTGAPSEMADPTPADVEEAQRSLYNVGIDMDTQTVQGMARRHDAEKTGQTFSQWIADAVRQRQAHFMAEWGVDSPHAIRHRLDQHVVKIDLRGPPGEPSRPSQREPHREEGQHMDQG